ncbi:major capsid protein [Mycobacterium phage Saintus]|uniref:Major capsid protein n=2 Tax=Fromanvirus TaxID=186764 RepID=G8IR96_9CAUD|nr:structural protein [Mycobacterium phage Fredward]YP_009638278.1 major capsid protein [Mycobacterium phage Saintus]QDH92967.1 major capsid protein [Mycobacterium phage Stephig9]QXN72984.1 major capsid protein [Mycobacterium phage Phillis]AER26397.1 major capsid protein [Mycobacterium phage Saintus]AGY36958.1 structural protein [Mycobacterium phage Fredward]
MAIPDQVAKTADFSAFLKPEQAQDYFAEIEKTSIVQKIARKVPMGPTGISIPFWNGAVSAGWVGEGEQKPLTKGGFDQKELHPWKIAVIFAETAEVVRLNPLNYLNVMRTKIAEAIALKFDAAALYGIDKPAVFQGYLAETTKKVSIAGTGTQNAYNAIGVDALAQLVNDGKKWTGTLLDNVTEPLLNGAVDANGRPLFVESTYEGLVTPMREGRILGRPTVLNDHVVSDGVPGARTLGFMGDFNQVIWGQIGGLSFDVTDQATLNFGTEAAPKFVSLWQHNMVAVRVEAEFAFMINDKDAFVKITDEPVTEPEEP